MTLEEHIIGISAQHIQVTGCYSRTMSLYYLLIYTHRLLEWSTAFELLNTLEKPKLILQKCAITGTLIGCLETINALMGMTSVIPEVGA